MNGEMAENDKKRLILMFSLALAAPIVFVILIFIIKGTLNIGYPTLNIGYPPAEILLSVLLGLSVIALVVALTFTAYIFKSLNLASPNHTLGLPEGSIRAVIALSLILIFMISSVFLYTQVSYIERTEKIDLSQAEYDNISKESIYLAESYPVQRNVSGNVTRETRYTVILRTPKNEESVDIAKQIITTVSTLVVAVAGFYFGSNAVAAASKAATGAGGDILVVPDPLIRKIEPSFGVEGTEDFELEITGKNLNSPTEVKLVKESDTGSDTIPCKDVTSSDTMIRCKCKLEISNDPEKDPVGTWAIVVINSQYAEDRLENCFTVKKE